MKTIFKTALIALCAVAFAAFFAACPEEPGNDGGTGGDIDSALYGTWEKEGGSLTVTFSSNGITWGGAAGTPYNNMPADKWTANNGLISITYQGSTTEVYSYTINGSGELVLTQPDTNSEHILVKTAGSGDGGTSMENAIQLTENQWADGNISTSDGQQWFTFTAAASTQYRIHVSFGTLNDLFVQLYYSESDWGGYEYNLYGSEKSTFPLTLTSGQTYYIRVRPYASSDSGTYKIAFNTSSSSPAGTWTPDGYTPIQLTENQWASGNISSSDGEQWFTFTATASTQFIHLTFGTMADLSVALYDSNGSGGVTYNSYNSSTFSLSRTLTSGQKYYIKVTPYSSSDSGTYQIAFGTFIPDGYTPIQLTENQWVNGSIPTPKSGQQWFTFTATASTQFIHLGAIPVPDSVYVTIYDSNGSRVDGKLFMNLAFLSLSLTSDQKYYIKVWRGYVSSVNTNYKIAFNASETPPTGN